MHDDKPIVRMEKNAVNKLGLFLIILIAIAFFGGGGYLLYKNRNNLDFSFPWEKSKEQVAKEEAAKEKKKTALERQKISITTLDKDNCYNVQYNVLQVEYSETDGYVIKVQLYNYSSSNRYFFVNYITIDGYQIDYDDELELPSREAKLETIKIPVAELDKYNLETFKKILIRITVTEDKDTKDPEKTEYNSIVIENDSEAENTQLPTVTNNVGKGDNLKIDYYKTEETADSTDVYFLLDNKNGSLDYEITINALKINDTIETNNEFREKIYKKCNKVVILSIPKKDYKEVDSLTISFFVLENKNIYLTKTATLDLTKK